MNVVLLDEQQIAFDIVLHEVEKAAARPDHGPIDVTLSGAISQRRLPARLAESTTRR